MAKEVVKHLVVDSGAFIKNAAIRDLGENVYTVRDVVNEIRDQATRDRLQVLPYELKFREPTPDAIKIVTEFACKTGDLGVLSATDIRLIALVYTLEQEHVGVDHIRTQPNNKVQYVMPGTGAAVEGSAPLVPGFYLKKSKPGEEHSKETSEAEEVCESLESCALDIKDEIECNHGDGAVSDGEHDDDDGWIIPKKTVPAKQSKASLDQQASASSPLADVPQQSAEKAASVDVEENAQTSSTNSSKSTVTDQREDDGSVHRPENDDNENDGDDGDFEDDDDEGWITLENIEEMKKASLAMNQLQISSVPVACITTDYAMQFHFGTKRLFLRTFTKCDRELEVSVDGMLIRRTTTKILRCYGCFKVTSDCQRQFCARCGNKTLSRVTVAYNDDGTIQYFFSRFKTFSKRGLRYSLPRPQGGKHANNPVLCEDQREAQKRLSKHSKKKVDVFDDDYVTNSSPFAPTDIYSRAATHGYIGRNTGAAHGRRNPNENHKLYGHKK